MGDVKVSEPEIVDKDTLRFVGSHATFLHALSAETTAQDVIPPLWGTFDTSRHTVRHVTDHASFGVIYGLPEAERSHPDELHYIAAARVTAIEDVPEGMVGREVPNTTFAVFTIEGHIRDLGKGCAHIYRTWLPASDWDHSGIADIEHYDERFDPMSDTSVIEYWVSVKPKGG